MRSMISRLNARVFTIMVAVVVTVWPALVVAQASAPAPTLKRVSQVWIGYLLMAVLTGLVLAVSLMPSKRTHQD